MQTSDLRQSYAIEIADWSRRLREGCTFTPLMEEIETVVDVDSPTEEVRAIVKTLTRYLKAGEVGSFGTVTPDIGSETVEGRDITCKTALHPLWAGVLGTAADGAGV